MPSKRICRLSLILGVGLSTTHLAQADSAPHYVPQTIHCLGSVCDTAYDKRYLQLNPPSVAGDNTYTFALANSDMGSITYYYVGSDLRMPFPMSLSTAYSSNANPLQPYLQGSAWSQNSCGKFQNGQAPSVPAQSCPYTNAPVITPPTPVPSPGTATLTFNVQNNTPFDVTAHLSDRNGTPTNFKKGIISANSNLPAAVTMYADANGSYNSEFLFTVGPTSSLTDASNTVLVSYTGSSFSLQPNCKLPVYSAAGKPTLINVLVSTPPNGYIKFCVNGAADCPCGI